MEHRALDELVARLSSLDANDRVKAAAELGEVGTPEVSPHVLKSAWGDETSTVRQMAIQAYYEILGEDAFDEIVKAAKTHFDDYVKIYAISVLGGLKADSVSSILAELLENDSDKIKITILRAMIHAHTTQNTEIVFDLVNDNNTMIRRNAIEALARWGFKKSQPSIKKILTESELDPEIKTIALFALASFGDTEARQQLMVEDIDEYLRIKLGRTTYTGRDGLLDALNKM
ncbi:MAG: HEAT repeat domain-containing protein [Candidatus Kariarchaeaceae archaeon]